MESKFYVKLLHKCKVRHVDFSVYIFHFSSLLLFQVMSDLQISSLCVKLIYQSGNLMLVMLI